MAGVPRALIHCRGQTPLVYSTDFRRSGYSHAILQAFAKSWIELSGNAFLTVASGKLDGVS